MLNLLQQLLQGLVRLQHSFTLAINGHFPYTSNKIYLTLKGLKALLKLIYFHILLQSSEVPNSPEVTMTDGPPRLVPPEEQPPSPIMSTLKQFYESKLGALSMGLAVGSLAVYIALRIYKAAK